MPYRVWTTYPESDTDRYYIYAPEINPEYMVSEPTCTRELNGAGELSFKMPPDHPNFGAYTRMRSTFWVAWVDSSYNETLIWRGRCISDSTDEYGFKEVTCEGEYAYLNDSVIPDSDPNDAYEDETIELPLWMYIAGVIAAHNHRVDANRRIHFDAIVDISEYNDAADSGSSTAYYPNGLLGPRTNTSSYYQKKTYCDYYSTWIQPVVGSDCLWVYSNTTYTEYKTKSCQFAHAYLFGDSHSRLAIVGIPDESTAGDISVFDDIKYPQGITNEPTNKRTVPLDVSGYPNAHDCLEDLIDEYEGYLSISPESVNYYYTTYEQERGGGSKPYCMPMSNNESSTTVHFGIMPVLRYVPDPGELGEQVLTYGDNLRTASIETDCSEMCTCLIATGKSDSDSTVGPITVKSKTGTEQLGQYWESKSWSDAEETVELYARALDYIEKHQAPTWTIDIEAVDKALLLEETERLTLGNTYEIIIPSLDVDTKFLMNRETLTLDNYTTNKYEWYSEAVAFDDTEFQNGGDETYRMVPLLNSHRDDVISAIEEHSWTLTDNYRLDTLWLEAMNNGATIQEMAYGIDRPNLSKPTWLADGTFWYFCPKIARVTIDSPFGAASFMMTTIQVKSTAGVGRDRYMQICSNPFSSEYLVYRVVTSTGKKPTYRYRAKYSRTWTSATLSELETAYRSARTY